MLLHTTSAKLSSMGNKLEVMGNIQGFVEDQCINVTDSFPLPVTGTEVRVSAGNEAIEFTGKYVDSTEQIGRKENIVGWYHSHPGYGCWLSKIDIDTQMACQSYQDPAIAIVVDPIQTVSSGRLFLKAFRTWPKDYSPPSGSTTEGEYMSIPKGKIEDYGVHYKEYYPLQVDLYKSTNDSYLLDLLWSKYWMSTFTSLPLLTNRGYYNEQIADISGKLEKVEGDIVKHSSYSTTAPHHVGNAGGFSASSMMADTTAGASIGKKKEETAFSKVTKDSMKLTVEMLNGAIHEALKAQLFKNIISQ